MTADEMMELAADKAIHEMSWESIEWLFQPVTQFELLVRIDLEGMREAAAKWLADDSPDAMPHRFRDEPYAIMQAAIRREEFYREMEAAKERLAGDVALVEEAPV
jgi:hypothetical protein